MAVEQTLAERSNGGHWIRPSRNLSHPVDAGAARQKYPRDENQTEENSEIITKMRETDGKTD